MADPERPRTGFDLKSIEASDRNNFGASLKLLGHAAALPDDLNETYELLNSAVCDLGDSMTKPQQHAAALYAVCRTHLQLGSISLMRLHSRPAFQETRTALEAAGIACEIVRDQTSFEIFSSDDGTEERRKTVRDRFKTNFLFSRRDTRLANMKEQWDLAARLSHTNAVTLRRHFGVDHDQRVAFSFQDITWEEFKMVLPSQFNWLCQAHVVILLTADIAFEPHFPQMEDFRKQRQYVFEKIQRFEQQRRGLAFKP